jgi:hypothetical protein
MGNRLFSLAVGGMLLLSSTTHAQLLDLGADSFVNAGFSTGVLVLGAVEDGGSRSQWKFDPAQQYRLTIDRTIGYFTSLGVTLAYAELPLRYRRVGGTPNPLLACPQQCDASADLWTGLASLHVRGGARFESVVEIHLGGTFYKNFRELSSDRELEPNIADRDIVFTIGYGGGWSVAPRLHLSLIGDVGFSIHNRSGSDGQLNAINTLFGLRAAVRTGIGR